VERGKDTCKTRGGHDDNVKIHRQSKELKKPAPKKERTSKTTLSLAMWQERQIKTGPRSRLRGGEGGVAECCLPRFMSVASSETRQSPALRAAQEARPAEGRTIHRETETNPQKEIGKESRSRNPAGARECSSKKDKGTHPLRHKNGAGGVAGSIPRKKRCTETVTNV